MAATGIPTDLELTAYLDALRTRVRDLPPNETLCAIWQTHTAMPFTETHANTLDHLLGLVEGRQQSDLFMRAFLPTAATCGDEYLTLIQYIVHTPGDFQSLSRLNKPQAKALLMLHDLGLTLEHVLSWEPPLGRNDHGTPHRFSMAHTDLLCTLTQKLGLSHTQAMRRLNQLKTSEAGRQNRKLMFDYARQHPEMTTPVQRYTAQAMLDKIDEIDESDCDESGCEGSM